MIIVADIWTETMDGYNQENSQEYNDWKKILQLAGSDEDFQAAAFAYLSAALKHFASVTLRTDPDKSREALWVTYRRLKSLLSESPELLSFCDKPWDLPDHAGRLLYQIYAHRERRY